MMFNNPPIDISMATRKVNKNKLFSRNISTLKTHTMLSILSLLLILPLIAADSEDIYIKSFLLKIAEEQCLSPSGILVQDEINAFQYGLFDTPTSIRYPRLNSELALILRNALGVAYNFPPDTPRSPTPKSYNSEEAVRMFRSCQAQDALHRLYNTQRFISNASIDECAENAYYIYYEDKLNGNLVQVENLDTIGVLDDPMASDCAVNIMNVFAKHFIQKNHALNKSHNTSKSKTRVNLNDFKEGTEWIELQKLVKDGSSVECSEETSRRRSVCTIFD